MLKYQKTKRQLKEEAQKLELESARARADEEARWIQEQNELVQNTGGREIYELNDPCGTSQEGPVRWYTAPRRI